MRCPNHLPHTFSNAPNWFQICIETGHLVSLGPDQGTAMTPLRAGAFLPECSHYYHIYFLIFWNWFCIPGCGRRHSDFMKLSSNIVKIICSTIFHCAFLASNLFYNGLRTLSRSWSRQRKTPLSLCAFLDEYSPYSLINSFKSPFVKMYCASQDVVDLL